MVDGLRKLQDKWLIAHQILHAPVPVNAGGSGGKVVSLEVYYTAIHVREHRAASFVALLNGQIDALAEL